MSPKPTFLSLLLVVFLVACSDNIPSNTPDYKIGLTLSQAPLRIIIQSCLVTIDRTAQVDVLPLTQLSEGDYDFIIRAGAPQTNDLIPYQVTSGTLRIIVNAANPLDNLDQQQAASIFLGMVDDWQSISPNQFQSPSPIHIWSYPAGDDVRIELEKYLLKGHSVSPMIYMAPDHDAMLQAVSGDPTAIGYGFNLQTEPGTKLLQISGVDNWMADIPVLAVFQNFANPDEMHLIQCLEENAP